MIEEWVSCQMGSRKDALGKENKQCYGKDKSIEGNRLDTRVIRGSKS